MSFDTLEKRCPRLGSPVNFGYCRISGQDNQLCFKVLDCWWEQFDVEAYLRQSLSAEEFNRLIGAPPPNKVAGLVELIEQARKRLKDEK